MYEKEKSKKLSTSTMIKISILSIIGFVFTITNIVLPFLPSFLRLDIGNVPAVIGTLLFGIYPGILIEFIKNLLKFILNNDTGGVGEIANFIIGISYIIPLYLVYNKCKNIKGYILGSMLGIILMTLSGAIFNYFILLPLYANIVGGIDLIINLANSVNSSIIDIKSLIIKGIIPFNILKGIIISIVGYLLFKSLNCVLSK